MYTRWFAGIAALVISALAVAQTTGELAEQAAKDLSAAEHYQAQVLADLRESLPPRERIRLDASDAAWRTYRNLSVELMANKYEGGSGAALFAANLKLTLTQDRTAALESYFAEGYKGAAPVVGVSGAPSPGEMKTFDGIDFCWIPAGEFVMGSAPWDQPNGDPDRVHDEVQHPVVLSKGFWMGKYEVTQGQWTAVMGSNPSENASGDRLPVENVDWNDCQAFIAKLNAAGSAYRLPTEAEWEYAARAGTLTPFSFGQTLTHAQANMHDGPGKTVGVGSYPANSWGLHDMHGNVAEWCADWYGPYPAARMTDPKGPPTGEMRIIRGGAWNTTANFLRSAYRNGNGPAVKFGALGFRLVRTEP